MSPTETDAPESEAPATDTAAPETAASSPHSEPPPPVHEPPPPGVFVMAIVRWILLLAITALAVWTIRKYGFSGHGAQSVREDRYYCPMHPQIRSPDPGECPICHMTLEPIPAERRAGATTAAIETDGGIASTQVGDASAMTAPTDASTTSAPVMLSLERRQAIDVATTAVTRRTIHEPLRVPAVVAARENGVSQVHVRSDAFIERVAVRETGVRVGAGDVLAWVYSPAVYRAQSDLFTAARWAGGSADAGDGAPSDAQRMANAARESLRLLGVADRDIDVIVRAGTPQRQVPLRATAGGIVTQRAAVPGLFAAPDMVLYEITDLSRVWMVANVFERDLPRVHRGDLARVRASGETADVEGRVVLVEPSIDPATRTARVRLEVPNPGMRWRPGAYGEASFATRDRSVLVVPRDAVIDTGDAQYVFVDSGEGQFEARHVSVGTTVDEVTEITAGLRDAERVVVRGGFLIDAESRLRSAATPGAAR